MKPVKISLIFLQTLISLHGSFAAPSGDDSIKDLDDTADRGMRALSRPKQSLNSALRTKFPLKAEEVRRDSKVSECRMGKEVHEIGDTWHPDLGEPFGTMYCIHCACEAVQKKRKMVGRVRCTNVKDQCPKLECKDAVSVPGQCCKVCAEDNPASKMLHDAADDDDSQSSNNREYAALLTPRSSGLIISSTGLGEPMQAGLASGRFIFTQKSLHYSFVYNEQLPRAKYVQFVDSDGNVIEEHEVTLNRYQEDTRKICGVWKKMPRIYRKLLKDEKIFAALVTEKISGDNDRFLAGRIAKQRYVSSEMYSGLLEASVQPESGGMAVMTVSPSTGSIYANVVFNGDFDEERDIGITVRISDASGSEAIEETAVIPKISYEQNSIEIRAILEPEHLESLAKGTLFMVVYSPRNPDFKMIGFIQARTTCDMFDTVLESDSTKSGDLPPASAWVYPRPDGSWSYNLHLSSEYQPTSVKIETGREVLDEVTVPSTSSNTIHAVMSSMGPRNYQLLYEENIYISVVTESTTLRGKLAYRSFGEAQLSDIPLVLESKTKSATTQGLLWASVDPSCSLNYQLTLSQPEKVRLELMETLELSMMGLPVKSYQLENSVHIGGKHEGIFGDFAKLTYAHLKAGDAMFKVIRVSDNALLASTVMKNVVVPQTCLPLRASVEFALDETQDDESTATLLSGKCFSDGVLREEYSQWSPLNDTCSICTCYKGQTKCDAVVCPALKCANSVLLTGECCRSCMTPDVPRGQGCSVDGDRFHPAGSSWHPYMSPNGYMLCTTCTCSPDTLTVKCTRQQCPALECAPEEAVYPKALSCCKVCPPKKTIDPDMVSDAAFQLTKQSSGPSESKILSEGGCKFRGELHENGEEWNHRTEPFGYIPCVSCTCSNGNTKCGRKKCPALSCEAKIQLPGQCCPACAVHSGGDRGSSKSSTRYRKPVKSKSH